MASVLEQAAGTALPGCISSFPSTSQQGGVGTLAVVAVLYTGGRGGGV